MAPWLGILATDSQSLLELITFKSIVCIKKAYTLRREMPGVGFASSILTELQCWPGITLQHVRGHQDCTTAYDRLPWLAQSLMWMQTLWKWRIKKVSMACSDPCWFSSRTPGECIWWRQVEARQKAMKQFLCAIKPQSQAMPSTFNTGTGGGHEWR